MIHYIYKIVNLINNKTYIGYTSRRNPLSRWKAHISTASTTNRPLYNAMRKYGQDQFTFDVIYCSKEAKHTLIFMEHYFITEYNSHISGGNGYNVAWGGQSNYGWVPNDNTRILWSEQRRGRKMSNEERANRSISMQQLYTDRPELRDIHRQNSIERGCAPPSPTPESRAKGAMTRTGKHIHTAERKRVLSLMVSSGSHPFNSELAKVKRKKTWKQTNRGVGSSNGKAVFCMITTPSGDVLGEGHLNSLCIVNSLPFDTFLAASRHGQALQRGKWKGWIIQRIGRPTD